MSNKLIKILISSIVIIHIISCSLIPNKIENYYNLSTDDWIVKGKISIQYPLNNELTKKETQIFNFEWKQKYNDFIIKIKIPFQIENIFIEKKDGNLYLRNQERVFNDVKRKNVWLRLKSEVPFDELSSWIFGNPSLKSIYKILPEKETVFRSFSQKGWLVEYPIINNLNAIQLPKKIRLSNDTYNIKIYIQNWEVESTTK